VRPSLWISTKYVKDVTASVLRASAFIAQFVDVLFSVRAFFMKYLRMTRPSDTHSYRLASLACTVVPGSGDGL
jgi:hypothetical protein